MNKLQVSTPAISLGQILSPEVKNHEGEEQAERSSMAIARKGLVLLPLVLLSMSPSFVSSQDNESTNAATLLKDASQLMLENQYIEALELLNSAVEAEPTLSEAYSSRASVLCSLCRYEESEKNYRKLLELKPRSPLAQRELSQLLQAQNSFASASHIFESGDHAKALEYLDKIVLVFSPGCLEAKLLKVKVFLALKDYPSVISETGSILKEDENNLEALYFRARAFYYLTDHDIALRHLQKGLRLDPEHSGLKKTYFGLKNLLKKTKSAEENAEKGKLRLAVEDFTSALAVDPSHIAHNVRLHLGLCKVFVKMRMGEEAIRSCSDALDLDDELPEALSQRGEAKHLVEDWEGAVNDLEAAVEKSPQDINIRETLMKAEKALKLSKRKDWYKILGIPQTASAAEIRHAYKKLALQWHPDKNIDNIEAEDTFTEIAAAYEVLGDEDRRARYDRGDDDDMDVGGPGFNPFGAGGQPFTFHFDGGYPGGFRFEF